MNGQPDGPTLRIRATILQLQHLKSEIARVLAALPNCNIRFRQGWQTCLVRREESVPVAQRIETVQCVPLTTVLHDHHALTLRTVFRIPRCYEDSGRKSQDYDLPEFATDLDFPSLYFGRRFHCRIPRLYET